MVGWLKLVNVESAAFWVFGCGFFMIFHHIMAPGCSHTLRALKYIWQAPNSPTSNSALHFKAPKVLGFLVLLLPKKGAATISNTAPR